MNNSLDGLSLKHNHSPFNVARLICTLRVCQTSPTPLIQIYLKLICKLHKPFWGESLLVTNYHHRYACMQSILLQFYDLNQEHLLLVSALHGTDHLALAMTYYYAMDIGVGSRGQGATCPPPPPKFQVGGRGGGIAPQLYIPLHCKKKVC